MKPNEQGFSLIEMLLSVVIISMLTVLSLPLYVSFSNRNDTDVNTENIASMLRRAQVYARGMNYDSAWGVHVQTGSATLFKGTTYASRDTAYDETTTIPGHIAVSGLADVSFSKLVAVPSTTGSVTLTANNNETRTITLNAEGMVSY